MYVVCGSIRVSENLVKTRVRPLHTSSSSCLKKDKRSMYAIEYQQRILKGTLMFVFVFQGRVA